MRFPDPDKYADVERVHGMCQLCSTVCGITGIVKDGRVIKVEGNPADPNSRGKLCARGQSSLQGLYNPDRVREPMAKGADGTFAPIAWDDAIARVAGALGADAQTRRAFSFR